MAFGLEGTPFRDREHDRILPPPPRAKTKGVRFNLRMAPFCSYQQTRTGVEKSFEENVEVSPFIDPNPSDLMCDKTGPNEERPTIEKQPGCQRGICDRSRRRKIRYACMSGLLSEEHWALLVVPLVRMSSHRCSQPASTHTHTHIHTAAPATAPVEGAVLRTAAPYVRPNAIRGGRKDDNDIHHDTVFLFWYLSSCLLNAHNVRKEPETPGVLRWRGREAKMDPW
jgi:hypothetical protein